MPRQLHTLKTMQDYAKQRDGQCLSSNYSGIRGTIQFECKVGHVWNTKPANALYKAHWCPTCGGEKTVPHTIDTFKVHAQSRGGECLSSSYNGVHKPLIFKCCEGHVWEAQPANLLHRNSWCPVCAKVKCGRKFGHEYIEKVKQIASDRLGMCLSNTYLGDKVHLLFECADGHQWWTTPNTIKRPHWCPFCKNGAARVT